MNPFGPIGYFFNIVFTYPIFNGLMLLYHVLGDFGLCIIVLTLIIKLILFPLTLQQLKSMKATQALQPQLAEIKKRYAKDQQAQMLATQELYKEYGINPLAGSCLPLLIQMPVLFGLFYALSSVVRGTPALHKPDGTGINDLIYPFLPKFSHLPDINLNWFTFINPALHISLGNPDPTHLLPILAALATFMQLRMSQPKTAATTQNDAMASQMKMMQYISPAMVLFFGWNYAAGLALYWTVSSLFAMFQQYFVTGWGSLLVTPNFAVKGSSNANSNGKTVVVDSTKETRVLRRDTDEGSDEDEEEGDSTTNRLTSSGTNGSSSARRRSRNGSASARRRSSNNLTKRNASRS